jgi:S1-C subfamily serine protease
MRPYLIACTISAALGAAAAIWLCEASPRAKVSGQEIPLGRRDMGVIDDTALDPRRAPAGAGSRLAEGDLGKFTPEERTNISVYEKGNRSVVHITTRAWSADRFFDRHIPSDGSGSGSVLDHEGRILTNFHVVEGASEIRVTLFTGDTFEAGLVGQDPPNDIAVLKIDAPAETLYPIELGDSTRLRVGQKVFAIGNPFGLDRTLTVGVLSSLNRKLPSRAGGREMESIIQVDAALNRGNSGGPLLNSDGSLIGMNTAIASQTGENTGVGFAIPVNTVKRVVPQLIEHGRVIRPVIGIASVYETDAGVVIVELVPGGPAERADLRGFRLVRKRERRGPYIYERTYVDRDYADVILSVDGIPVKTGDELLDIVEGKKPGDRLIVRVLRESRQVDVLVILDESE